MRTSLPTQIKIKGYEQLRLEAYLCPAGKWTIGWGHTKDVKPGDRITEEIAEKLFQTDLELAEYLVNWCVNVQLSNNMFDALVSFTFNLGGKNLMKSTLLNRLNRGLVNEAAAEFPKWVWATQNGKHVLLDGLVKRRHWEYQLFTETEG